MGAQMRNSSQRKKMIESIPILIAFLAVGLGAGIAEEVAEIATNKPIEIATHNIAEDTDLLATPVTFPTEKHIDDFSILVVKNDQKPKCKCPRKKKVCENGEKPTFNRNRASCQDGSKPRCPADRCTGNEEAQIGDTIENNRKCKCPRKRKICENGEKPNFKKNQPRCNDGSKPRCPAKRCSNKNQSSSQISAVTQETTTDAAIFHTGSDFSTDKHVDPVATRNPNDELFLLIEVATVTPEPLFEATPPEFSTEKHVDPFPELESQYEEEVSTENVPEFEVIPVDEDRVFPALFSVKTEMDVSATPQCLQDGIVTCSGVSLNTDILTSLTEGSVVMLLSGQDFTMELQRFALAKSRSSSYHFQLSNGGSATMTVGEIQDPEKQPSVYATIRTHGQWLYFVESCGVDCTVIYTRDANYFNNFED